MNSTSPFSSFLYVSAGCHINDVMNLHRFADRKTGVSAGCHINDVMNDLTFAKTAIDVSAGCHINDVMNNLATVFRC